ncbi:hypothetical protein D3C86_1163340 [compost metagenome]
MKNVFWPNCIGYVTNHAVVLRPQVGERGDEGARANARHDLEPGAGPMRGPSGNQPRCECACISAAGNCQHVCDRQDIVRLPGLGEQQALTFVGLNRILNERGLVMVQPVASIRDARDDGFFRQGWRHRVSARQTRLKKHVQRGARSERKRFQIASSGLAGRQPMRSSFTRDETSLYPNALR